MNRTSPLIDDASSSDPLGRRGRLTIFLGAARGVGTSRAMLQSALVKEREPADVIVGLGPLYTDREADELATKLEAIPAKIVEHEGRLYSQLDLDAIFDRKPTVVVVDDLGGVNAPRSRNPMRYQDVEELLAAGIDVYTTVKVEQIEGLSEVIGQIIGIPVKGTIPDGIVENADDLVVIDFTAEDLAQRWRDGQIMLPDELEKVAENYFSASTLAALRELALRRTAQRVDDQMLAFIREYVDSAARRPTETVLVCIDETSLDAGLIHYASQLAARMQANWIALYVESGRYERLSEGDRNRIADGLRLAERLGACALMIPGSNVAEEILVYARNADARTIVLGRSRRSRLAQFFRPSIATSLVHKGIDVSIQVIAGNQIASMVRPLPRFSRLPFDPLSHFLSLASVGIATLFCLPFRDEMKEGGVAMAYLTTVLVTAVSFGFFPAFLASIAAALSYDYFFTEPLYSLEIASFREALSVVMFLIVALITSSITAQSRSQTAIARNRAKTTAELYGFSRRIAELSDLGELEAVVAQRISTLLQVGVAFLMPEAGGLVSHVVYPPESAPSDSDVREAEAVFRGRRPPAIDRSPDTGWQFFPLRTARRILGVIGVARAPEQREIAPGERRLLLAIIDQTTVAIERIMLVADNEQTRILRETENFRSSLLRSIAHDIRTPLASVLGAVTALRRQGNDDFTPEARDNLLAIAQEESERLNRFVGNLLDMTRLESGVLAVKRDLVDVDDIVASAVRRARLILADHELATEIADDLPMLRLDSVLVEQALFNLLDNAAKYSAPGGKITVSARRTDGFVTLSVADEGEGIPNDDLERIFDKFYRVRGGDRARAGTGLGLTICRGFIDVQGGTIVASNRRDRQGAVFTISLPIEGSWRQK